MLLNKITLGLLCAILVSAPVSGQPDSHHVRSAGLHRAADPGYLGVGVIEVTADRVKALNLKDDHGVEVKRVEENSAAAKAGLKENDVILELNGKSVDDVDEFIHAVAGEAAGVKVNLTVWRNGAKQTISATLDSRPGYAIFVFPDGPTPPMPPMPPVDDGPFPGMTGNSARIGFEGETLSPQLAAFFGVREGVLVRSVDSNTPAEKAGLKAGDVVIKVNGTPVTSAREISGMVRANRAKAVAFTVVRGKKEISLSVQIVAELWAVPFREVL